MSSYAMSCLVVSCYVLAVNVFSCNSLHCTAALHRLASHNELFMTAGLRPLFVLRSCMLVGLTQSTSHLQGVQIPQHKGSSPGKLGPRDLSMRVLVFCLLRVAAPSRAEAEEAALNAAREREFLARNAEAVFCSILVIYY